jgi:hypothetical protein
VKLLLNASAIQEPITGENIDFHLFMPGQTHQFILKIRGRYCSKRDKKQMKKQKQTKKPDWLLMLAAVARTSVALSAAQPRTRFQFLVQGF